ncbi:unnamed protein product [Diamesa serratosioi]
MNDGETCKVWTLAMNEESTEAPLLLVHGLGAASAVWILNLDEQAKVRPVYAIDVPGFGKSSRVEFTDDPILAEQKLVEIIEKWRVQMKLSKMILLGHSMGGFISFSYALSYPERLVQHLILADPWGLTKKPSDGKPNIHSNLTDQIAFFFSKFANPLGILRLAGPFGQLVVEFTFPELVSKITTVVGDKNTITQYLQQANLQTPTGEEAFKTMMDEFYWTKNPIIVRLDKLNTTIPMTLILGEKSWIDKIDETSLKKIRSNSYVMYHVIQNVGHELFAYNSNEFNSLVSEACTILFNKTI